MEYHFSDEARKLIKGAYDVHVHPDPSHFKRNTDDFELVRRCDELEMAGVMIKSHYDPTGARARLANKYAGAKHTKAYGGVALNWPVGGLNPYSAECNFKMGGSVVWMPTRDTANCLQYGDMAGDFFKRPGITAFDENKKLKKEIYEILEVIKKYDGILATGHFYLDETLALCDAALDMGVKTILTHPDWIRTKVPLELQVDLAKKGVYIEKLWGPVYDKSTTQDALMASMREIGYEHIVCGTDGAFGTFDPTQAIMDLVQATIDAGLPEDGIRTMLAETPASLFEG